MIIPKNVILIYIIYKKILIFLLLKKLLFKLRTELIKTEYQS